VNITVSEQSLIWGCDCPIDINVSLGCGTEPETDKTANNPTIKSHGGLQKLKEMFPGRLSWLLGRYVVDLVQATLNAEKTWVEYLKNTKLDKQRCIRLNTPLNGPAPELHDVTKIEELEVLADQYWSNDIGHETIQRLAQKLLASSFYFDCCHKRDVGQGQLSVKGRIPQS